MNKNNIVVVNNKTAVQFKVKFQKNIRAMWSLGKLINASYWQSIFGPVMTFVFGAIFIGLYGLIMETQFSNAGNAGDALFKSALIGVISLQVMSFAINVVPQSINDFKTSVLLKRIGSTPIKPITFLLTVSIYYGVLMFISFFWNMLMVVIWFPSKIGIIFAGDPSVGVLAIEWGSLIFAIFYTVITSIFIGLLVVSLSKSAIASNVIGMIIFFLSMFLSGMLFPIQNITPNLGLNIVSYFTPFRYTTGLMTMSWNGNSIFDMSGSYKIGEVVVYQVYDKWLNLFMPLVFIGLALFFSAKNFKWNVR